MLLATAVLIGLVVMLVGAPGFDASFVVDARRLRDGWIGQVMRWHTDVGHSRRLTPVVVVVALLVAVRRRSWREALFVGLATPVAAAVTSLLKQLFERARPEGGIDAMAAGWSMPSGHATASAAFATSLVLLTPAGRPRRIVLEVASSFAVLVGISRVALGVHFPSDVIAGWCCGVGVTLLLAAALGIPEPDPIVE